MHLPSSTLTAKRCLIVSLCCLVTTPCFAEDYTTANDLFATDTDVEEWCVQSDFSQRFSQIRYNDDIANIAIRFDQNDVDSHMFNDNADFEDTQPSTWTFGYALGNDKDYQLAFEFLRIDAGAIDVLNPDSMIRELELVQQLSFRIAY